MMRHDVTVVVPTKNEAENIPAFLQSIPADIPLIAVDDSADETPGLIKRLRPHNTRVIRRQSNIPAARQIGAEACRTAWTLHTDADVRFAPDYFAQLVRHQDADALYGLKRTLGVHRRYDQLFYRGQLLLDRVGIPAVSGSNFLVKRDVLLAVGGFDCSLSCNEDSELGWRIAKQGYMIRLESGLVVYEHDHRRLERGTARKLIHSFTRCSLLYTGLMPRRWRSSDWGYWTDIRT